MLKCNKMKENIIIKKDFGLLIFITLIFITFIPVFAINSFNKTRYEDILIESSVNKNSIIVEKSKNILNIHIKDIIEDINALTDTPSLKLMNYKKIVNILVGIDRDSDIVRNVFLANKEGEMLYSTSGVIMDIRNEDYFLEVMNNKESIFSKVIVSSLTNNPLEFVYCSPIILNNKVNGIIGVRIDIKYMNELLDAYRREDRELHVIDQNGLILDSKQFTIDNEAISLIESHRKNMQKILRENDINSNKININKEYIINYDKLENGNLTLVAKLSNEEIKKTLNKYGRFYLFINIIIFILVLIISYYLSFYFTKPLNQLTIPIKEISEGNIDVELTPYLLDRKDQFGELAHSFNNMLDKIRRLTFYDTLTKIPNRLFFFNKLNKLIQQTKNEEKIGVAYIDIDSFKVINETWGSETGDLVLKEIIKRIKENFNNEYFLARMDGDELAIIINDYESIDEISKKIEKISKITNEQYYIEDNSIQISISIGAAIFPDDAKDAKELIKKVYFALNKAKKNYEKKCQFYNMKLYEEIKWLNQIKHDMSMAIEKGEFEVYYQPLYDLQKNRIYGAEALLRWHHKKFGMISPEVFIPIAEESKIIIDIGEWVLKTACEQNKKWQELGIKDLVMSVNISPRHFIQDGFVGYVENVINKLDYKTELLKIEITETVAIGNEELTINIQKKLRDIGIKIALDDFGTGYSSLSYISKFIFDTIKIDKEFLLNLNRDKRDVQIVASIISIGKILGSTIVAEGVETKEHVNFLIENGCHIAQGYYYSRPLKAKDFYEYLIEINKN